MHPPSPPSELGIPLYFQANEPGASVAMIGFDMDMWEETDLQCHLQYSTDGMATWAAWDGHVVRLDECTDNKVYLRAEPGNPNTNGFYNDSFCHYFKTDKSVAAGGNIQFLLESTGTRTDVPTYGFAYLFSTLEQYSECTSLTRAPLLPATTLAKECYYNMFYGCTSLTQAPALSATTLASSCCMNMFYGCSSLTQAPALSATTLAYGCYESMFSACESLSSIDVSFTAWDLSSATYSWVYDVAASGTFTCPSDLPQTFGVNNIPEGWTVVTK